LELDDVGPGSRDDQAQSDKSLMPPPPRSLVKDNKSVTPQNLGRSTSVRNTLKAGISTALTKPSTSATKTLLKDGPVATKIGSNTRVGIKSGNQSITPRSDGITRKLSVKTTFGKPTRNVEQALSPPSPIKDADLGLPVKAPQNRIGTRPRPISMVGPTQALSNVRTTTNPTSHRRNLSTVNQKGDTLPKRPTTADNRSHSPVSPIKTTFESSKPTFNNFKVEYPQTGPPVPKPATGQIIHPPTTTATTQISISVLHAQTRLLQLSILHAQSFATTASLVESAETQLRQRYDEVQSNALALDAIYYEEQDLIDYKGLEKILLADAIAFGSTSSHYTNAAEAIRSFSDVITKLLRLFTTDPAAPGEYHRLVSQFENWFLQETNTHVDGLTVEFGREIIRVRRKLDTGHRALEFWQHLLSSEDKSDEEGVVAISSIAIIVSTLADMVRVALEELSLMQKLEKQIVEDARRDLRQQVDELLATPTDEMSTRSAVPVWMR